MSPIRQRLYIWRITHAQDIRSAILLMVLAGLYLLASSIDYQDALEQERFAREAAEQRLEAMQPLSDYPRVAFVIDARTRQDAIDRIAEIEGALGRERYELRWGKK